MGGFIGGCGSQRNSRKMKSLAIIIGGVLFLALVACALVPVVMMSDKPDDEDDPL